MAALTQDQRRVVATLVAAYREGWFPMARGRDSRRVRWHRPPTRGVIALEEGGFVVPRSLRARVRAGPFRIAADTAFERVIRACAEPRAGDRETWINADIIAWYTLLYRAGVAHSVEAWRGEGGGARLVGGLYGLAIGGLFAGESMFARPAEGGTDASKVCLVHLVGHLRRRGFTLLDTQVWNEHTARFGCAEVTLDDYLARLGEAVSLAVTWGEFSPSVADAGPEPAPRRRPVA